MAHDTKIHAAFYHKRNCTLSFKFPALPKNSNNFTPLAEAGRVLEITIKRNSKHGGKTTGRLREKHATQCNEADPNESKNRLPWKGQ